MTHSFRLVLPLTLLSLSAGCSSAEWVHPNRPKDQFAQDYNKCQEDILRDPKLQQGIQLLKLEATERCLHKQGWSLMEKE